MGRNMRWAAMLGACAVLSTCPFALAGPAALASQTAPSAAEQWRVVARLPNGVFGTVIAPARANAWAFGAQQSTSAGPAYAVARHWNGHRWSSARRIYGRKNSSVVCAGASSSSNIWAFTEAGGGGGNPPSNASALRLLNGRWVTDKVLSAVGTGSFITGCNVLGPADVWAFGGVVAGIGRGVGTWHLTRSGWTRQNTGNLVLFHASAVSASDMWAAAADMSTRTPQPALVRWNGRTWAEDHSFSAALPKSKGTRWVATDAVKAFSDRDVWAAAVIVNGNSIIGIKVVHWNGKKWSRVKPGSRGYYLPNAVPDGKGGWWSAPYLTTAGFTRYLLHEANGHWTRFRVPSPLNIYSIIVAHVPRSRAMLAVGAGPVLAYGKLPS